MLMEILLKMLCMEITLVKKKSGSYVGWIDKEEEEELH